MSSRSDRPGGPRHAGAAAARAGPVAPQRSGAPAAAPDRRSGGSMHVGETESPCPGLKGWSDYAERCAKMSVGGRVYICPQMQRNATSAEVTT